MSTCGRGRNLLQRPKQASSLGKKPLEFSTSSSPPTTTAELSTISYFLSFLLNILNITKTQTEVTVNRVISSYSWHSFQKRISFTILLQIPNPPYPPPHPRHLRFILHRRGEDSHLGYLYNNTLQPSVSDTHMEEKEDKRQMNKRKNESLVNLGTWSAINWLPSRGNQGLCNQMQMGPQWKNCVGNDAGVERQEDWDFFGTYLYGINFKSSLSGTDGITNTISTSRQTGIAITSGAGKHSQFCCCQRFQWL